jgi:excisionase family DNA binding protein
METDEPRGRRGQRLTFTIEETAAALGIDRSTCYELAAADRLPVPVLRLGRRMVVGRRALERALAGRVSRRTAGVGDGAN